MPKKTDQTQEALDALRNHVRDLEERLGTSVGHSQFDTPLLGLHKDTLAVLEAILGSRAPAKASRR